MFLLECHTVPILVHKGKWVPVLMQIQSGVLLKSADYHPLKVRTVF
jgi:hypothetical protein